MHHPACCELAARRVPPDRSVRRHRTIAQMRPAVDRSRGRRSGVAALAQSRWRLSARLGRPVCDSIPRAAVAHSQAFRLHPGTGKRASEQRPVKQCSNQTKGRCCKDQHLHRRQSAQATDHQRLDDRQRENSSGGAKKDGQSSRNLHESVGDESSLFLDVSSPLPFGSTCGRSVLRKASQVTSASDGPFLPDRLYKLDRPSRGRTNDQRRQYRSRLQSPRPNTGSHCCVGASPASERHKPARKVAIRH